MFHGTRQEVLENIFTTNLANLSKGPKHGELFGKGVYHTRSAEYACLYAKETGALLVNWVCFSSVYPVIHHPEVADDLRDIKDIRWTKVSKDLQKKHWVHLTGCSAPISTNYNAHYALVRLYESWIKRRLLSICKE